APGAVGLPAVQAGPWQGVGTGFAASDGLLAQRLGDAVHPLDPRALPHAAHLVRLAAAALPRGEAVAPQRTDRAYLRDNVALTLAGRRALRDARGWGPGACGHAGSAPVPRQRAMAVMAAARVRAVPARARSRPRPAAGHPRRTVPPVAGRR